MESDQEQLPTDEVSFRRYAVEVKIDAHRMWAAFIRKSLRHIRDGVRAAIDARYLVGAFDGETADKLEAEINIEISKAVLFSIDGECEIERPFNEYPYDDGEGAVA